MKPTRRPCLARPLLLGALISLPLCAAAQTIKPGQTRPRAP